MDFIQTQNELNKKLILASPISGHRIECPAGFPLFTKFTMRTLLSRENEIVIVRII